MSTYKQIERGGAAEVTGGLWRGGRDTYSAKRMNVRRNVDRTYQMDGERERKVIRYTKRCGNLTLRHYDLYGKLSKAEEANDTDAIKYFNNRINMIPFNPKPCCYYGTCSKKETFRIYYVKYNPIYEKKI